MTHSVGTPSTGASITAGTAIGGIRHQIGAGIWAFGLTRAGRAGPLVTDFTGRAGIVARSAMFEVGLDIDASAIAICGTRAEGTSAIFANLSGCAFVVASAAVIGIILKVAHDAGTFSLIAVMVKGAFIIAGTAVKGGTGKIGTMQSAGSQVEGTKAFALLTSHREWAIGAGVANTALADFTSSAGFVARSTMFDVRSEVDAGAAA